jgi:hypothetical protein
MEDVTISVHNDQDVKGNLFGQRYTLTHTPTGIRVSGVCVGINRPGFMSYEQKQLLIAELKVKVEASGS